jgi:predicted PurR-regulated permease PerM
MDTIKFPFSARLAFTLIGIVFTIFLLKVGATLFIPMFLGLLIAVLLYPLTLRLEKWHLPPALAAICAVLLFVLVSGGFIYFFSLQIANFSEDLPELKQRVLDMFHNLQQWVHLKYHINSEQQSEFISKSADGMASAVANSIGNTFLWATEILVWAIFMLFYTFFLLYYRRLLRRFILALFSSQNQTKVHEVLASIRTMINSYVMGLLIEMLVLAVVTCTVFSIVGIRYAIMLGLLAAVLNIIPYLGIYTVTAICMVVTFANSGSTVALEVGVILLVIHFIDANIMMPKIVGGRIKMNPFITIVAVVVGNLIWGIPGMFLFIPLIAIIKIICERVDGLKSWAILIGEDEKGL